MTHTPAADAPAADALAADAPTADAPTAENTATRTVIAGLAEMTLETSDIERLERFYTELIGLPVLSREEDRVWLAVGERTRLGLWTPGEKEYGDEGGRHVHFAFAAAPGRLDALEERLGGAGVEVRGPVEHPGGDRSIYFEDPAGNVVEVWDYLERPKGRREGVDGLA